MTPSHFHRARPAAAVLLALVIAAAACSPPSQQDMQTAQALTELGESYNDLRLTQQELQDQVDSLKTVVAKQDSVIRTLANLAGVQPPR
jgi:septal ring factor EnvC (AmiA/AmiB activator)